MTATSPGGFVRFFRDAAPYIRAHRGRVVVVSVPGELLASEAAAPLAHDLALLAALGVRLVLVPGIRHQVEQALGARGLPSRVAAGLRVTDDAAMAVVSEVAGAVRVAWEALLTGQLANTPLGDRPLRLASGNFVLARPLGVRDGIDYGHTGVVRRVDAEAITRRLDADEVVLVPPIGYSPSGELFDLSAVPLAASVAAALAAAKLVYLLPSARLVDAEGRAVHELTVPEATALLATGAAGALGDALAEAVRACRSGVRRVHLVDQSIDGGLLLELFTRDGVGTLVAATPFDQLRTALVEDVPGIRALIDPLERSGALVPRPAERLEAEIEHFTVVERDGTIVACAALYPIADSAAGELACVAVHPDYQGAGFGDALLRHLERRAREQGLRELFVLTTEASHWFRERGFEPADAGRLPPARRAVVDSARNSRVLRKAL